MSLSGGMETTNYTSKNIMGRGPKSQFLTRPVTIKSGETIVVGDIVAKETSSGLYRKYNTSGSGGLEVAIGIATEDVTASGGNVVIDIFIRGNFITSRLGSNFDADALGQLNGRQVEGETLI